ncbi:DUF432 domain-containing protein [Mangrovibacterium sp.]|uniref:DUF432 domain-containing protein n=1 Tax=Mangrovibacterium sp. TaxID=1961364 RepID=UPI00356A936F
MQNRKTIWGKHEGKTNQILQLACGYSQLNLQYFSGGWAIKTEKLSEKSATINLSSLEQATSLVDANIYQTGRSTNLILQPTLPAKPIVFRTNTKIIIRQHQSMRLYIKVPLSIQLYYKQTDADHLLTEVDSERLSDTWFGEPDSGTPAFAGGSLFALQANDLPTAEYEILIPLNIQNNSTQLLDLQRLLVHVEIMNVYQVGARLIADTATIEFKGQGQVGNLQIGTDKTIHGTNPVLVGKARQASNRTILGHSFHFIKQMTQL